MRIIFHSIFFPSQDLGSRDLDEDWLDCGLTETDSSGYLHLPHITQVFRKKTHCLQRIHNTVFTYGHAQITMARIVIAPMRICAAHLIIGTLSSMSPLIWRQRLLKNNCDL